MPDPRLTASASPSRNEDTSYVSGARPRPDQLSSDSSPSSQASSNGPIHNPDAVSTLDPSYDAGARTAASGITTSAKQRLPRVLITGFSVFPGAPLNPTEKLVPLLTASYAEGSYAGWCASLKTAVLPVEYEAVASRLPVLLAGSSSGESDTAPDGPTNGFERNVQVEAEANEPDIIIHFGLYSLAPGIQLERFARNTCRGSPDNAGYCKAGVIDTLRTSGEAIPSTLPLDEIHSELERRNLPVCWSDDAGGYLCNYVFYLSAKATAPETKASALLTGGRGRMVGFVHVPPEYGDTAIGNGMELQRMKEAAEVILRLSCDAWRRRRDV